LPGRFLSNLFCPPRDSVGQFACREVRGRRFEFSTGINLEVTQFLEHGSHPPICIAKEYAPANSHKNPTQPFENRLTFHVVCEFLERMVAVTITFDGEASSVAFHDQINSPGTDFPLGRDSVTRC
jgi:hypothetical protein